MPKLRPAKRFWRKNQQSTCRDQWCESGMRQKDPNTPASYTWNQENPWKSCFFNSVFKWNCIWMTSEKIGSGWGTGLQSVLNRPTKRLEPASRPRSSRNDWCVCRDQLVHIRLPAPAPEKSGVLAAIFFFSTFAPPNWVHFWKRLQKPKLSVFEPTWRKREFNGFIKVTLKF